MSNHANALNKVKVLVVGDSGVGKSSLVHMICHDKVLSKASWTIGCSVEVKVHEYREGTPSHQPYFVELWDIGGNNSHKSSRHVFYNPVHGIILVHDLTNRKSQQNLHAWLMEVLLKEGGGIKSRLPLVDNFDAEQFGGFAQMPVLVIGTRLDQMAEVRTTTILPRSSSIAEQCSAVELYVSCVDKRSLAPGSGNAVKLSRFFDKVIEQQQTVGRLSSSTGPVGPERDNPALRRNKPSSSIFINS